MKTKSLISIAAVASFLMMMSCSNSDKKNNSNVSDPNVSFEDTPESHYQEGRTMEGLGIEYDNEVSEIENGPIAPTDGIPDEEYDEYDEFTIK